MSYNGWLLPASAYVISSDVDGRFINEAMEAHGQLGAFVGVCNGTADNVEIQAAIDALTSGRTWIETIKLIGSFTIADSLVLASYTHLDLTGAKIALANATNKSMITATSSKSNIGITGGILNGNRANQTTAGVGISFSDVSDSVISGVTVQSTWDVAIYIESSNGIRVLNNNVSDVAGAGTAFGINIYLSEYCLVQGNQVSGGLTGIMLNSGPGLGQLVGNIVKNNTTFDQTGTDSSGIILYHQDRFVVEGNYTYNATYYGIHLRESRYGVVANNVGYYNGYNSISLRGHAGPENAYGRDIQVVGNISLEDYYAGIYVGSDYEVSVTNNFVVGSRNGPGIEVYGSNHIISNNHSYNNAHSGIHVGGADYLNIVGNFLLDNNQTIGVAGAGIFLAAGSTYNIIEGNIARGNQRYGIQEVDNTADYNTIIGNHVSGSTYGQLVKSGADTIVRNNRGYVTENSGTATVANGDTTVTVTHSLGTTPTRVQVTPTLLSNATSFWVTSKGATTFVINVDADPGAGTATFDWRAQVGEG